MQVSVVIPCYNSLTYLGSTLESVFEQDLSGSRVTDYEVLLVDDGGTDDLAGWLASQEYPAEGDRRVRLVRQENAGVSAARNFGIRQSTGEVIAFCDSDDLWSARTASRLAAAIERSPSTGLSFGGYDIIDETGRSTGRVSLCDWEGDVWDRLITGNTISASVVMIRRTVFDDVGFFAENRDRFPVDVEDWEMFLRIAAKWEVAAVPEVLMHVRRHGSNSSLNIESIEIAYQHLLDVAFEVVGPSKDRLRPIAAANIQIRIASMWLNDRLDARKALAHLSRARSHSGGVRLNSEYWTVWLTAWFLRLAGVRGYEALRAGVRRIRHLRWRGSL